MNSQIYTTPNLASPLPQPVAWIGLDWGHHEHAFSLQDRNGGHEEGTFKSTSENLHQWARELEQRWGGQPVALAIEGSRGAAIHVLTQYPWIQIYPINPATSALYRQAFTPSRASDDLPDARVLLELVRDHCAKLRPLESQDPDTLKLDGLVRARRDFVDRRTQLTNQILTHLRDYYPQALELFSSLDSDLAVDLLRRWPDLISLKSARPATLKTFYYQHLVRRPALIERRLQWIRQAVAVTTEDSRISVAVMRTQCLVDQLRVLRQHIAHFETQIQSVFADHQEAFLFANLPGAGPQMAPRLCALFGTLRSLYPDPASLQQLAGIAPVREKSGNQEWIHWRPQAPRFLRQTLVEWAGLTVKYSAWAGAYYRHMQAKGKKRGTILRALAFKWVRILWKCWQTRTPYDEARYLKQLALRQSPYAPKI